MISALVNLKLTVQNFSTCPYWQMALCLILFLHNVATGYYNYQLGTWYIGSMAVRNMHAVEETMIGNLYDKARYHKLYTDGEVK